jgi:hypothetical protein
VTRVLLIIIVVLGVRAIAGEAPDDNRAGADASTAILLFEEELKRLRAQGEDAQVRQLIEKLKNPDASTVGGQSAQLDVARAVKSPTTRAELKEALTDVLVEAALDIPATKAVTDKYVPVTMPIVNEKDPNARGPGGVLWCFWAVDVPCNGLAKQLHAFRMAREDVRLAEINLMPLNKALGFIRKIRTALDEMSTVVLSPDPNIERQLKQIRVQEIIGPYLGINDMVNMFRPGGYRLLDDTTVAHALDVRTVPCFRYCSPRGVVHKLDGLSPDTDLAAWVAAADLWENEHLNEEYQRAFNQPRPATADGR